MVVTTFRTMREKRWVWIVVYVLATAVLAAGAIVLVNDRRSDANDTASAAELPDLAPMPFASDLSVVGQPVAPIGSQVSLRASGYSPDGVASIDLYDGARRVATVAPSAGSDAGTVAFPALTAGPHLLHAQVTDTEGKQSLTAPVSVDILVAQGTQAAAVTITADEGETPEELAARLGLEPGEITAFPPGATGTDPQIAPDEPIPADATVTAIVPADNGIDDGEAPEVVVTNPTGSASPNVESSGDPMTLTGAGSDCSISLTAKGSDGPVFYFDQNAGVPGWASVGETDGDGTLELPAQDPGIHVFFARTDTKKTEPVSVTVPFACADDTGWTGDSTLIDGILRSPKSKEQFTYFMLSVDDAPWVRVPADQDAALGPEPIKDVASFLPALSGKRLNLEVWERNAFTAFKIGSGKLVVPDGRTLTDVIGEPNALRLSVREGAPAGSVLDYQLGTDDETLTFKWQSASSRVDEVMWQVLAGDAGINNTDLTPPNLIAAGTSKRSTEDDTGLGGAGAFQIDTANIPGHEPPNADEPPVNPYAPKLVALTPPVTAATLADLGSAAFGKPIDVLDETETWQLPLDLPGQGDNVYVRVVANPKGPAVAAASPTLTIELPTFESVANNTGISMDIDATTVSYGRPSNPALVNCVDITVPWTDPRLDPKPPPLGGSGTYGPQYDGGYVSAPLGSLDPLPSWTAEDSLNFRIAGLKAFYPVSGTYCLSDFPPPEGPCDSIFCDLYYGAAEAFEVVGGVVGTLYDLVEYAYNGVISGIVFAIANFNPICVALKEASTTAGSTCTVVVGIAARAVVTAVLATFGLPAALPKRSELEKIAQGELEGLAVELMKQYGIPCEDIESSPELATAIDSASKELGVTEGGDAESIEDPCRAIAHLVIQTVKEELETAAETSISQASGLPNGAGIEGFTMVAAAKGVGEPAEVSIIMQPTKDTADATGAVCNIEVRDSAFGLKSQPHYYQLYEDLLVTEADPIDGQGVWTGTVLIPPVNIPNYGTFAQNATVTMYGRRQHPSNCSHPEFQVTNTIPPFLPR